MILRSFNQPTSAKTDAMAIATRPAGTDLTMIAMPKTKSRIAKANRTGGSGKL
jgi:hypothetical protein